MSSNFGVPWPPPNSENTPKEMRKCHNFLTVSAPGKLPMLNHIEAQAPLLVRQSLRGQASRPHLPRKLTTLMYHKKQSNTVYKLHAFEQQQV
jgi:hypothetical protein